MIIVIAGPTGVGKTKLSIELAKKYNAEIINADSVQVYKKIDIASAKVTEEEKEGIPHHLFDIKEYDEDYTVYDYQIDARKVLDNLLKENKYIAGKRSGNRGVTIFHLCPLHLCTCLLHFHSSHFPLTFYLVQTNR